MKNKFSSLSIIITLLIIVTLSLFAGTWFNNLVLNELETSAKSTLKEMANEQSRAIELIVHNKQDNVKGIVDVITHIGNDVETLYETLPVWTKEYEIETIIITDLNGEGITSCGELTNISGMEYFATAAVGEIHMSNVYTSDYSEKSVIALSSPIYYDGSVQAVIIAEYDVLELASLLIGTTDNRGSSMIVNSEGTILLHTYPFEISFENFQTAEFYNGSSYQDILDDFASNTGGDVTFSIGGDRKIGQYIPLGIDDWNLFFEVSETELSKSSEVITNGMLIISICIFLAFSIFIIYILSIRKRALKEIETVAYYDELTSLPNLVKFKLDLSQIVTQKDFDKSNYILLKGDIENFKVINEVYGFDVGNQVIYHAAQLAKQFTGKHSIVARIGSDQLLIFTEKDIVEDFFKNRAQFNASLKQLVPAVSNHILNFRYGRYFMEENENNIDNMINKVSIAHSYARTNTSWPLWDYDEKFHLHMLRMTELTNKMEDSLKHHEFHMFLQPKYDIQTGMIVGAEALVRWFERNGNVVYPNDFIPLFEKNEFITVLDEYIFESACILISNRLSKGQSVVPISVNFSRRHLQNKDFVNRLSSIAQKYNVPTSYLEVELTETAIIDNVQVLSEVISNIHAAGFKISMDDFGSGYSSLGMLKEYKFDIVKLDRSFFICEEEQRENAKTVLRGIIQLVNSLGSRIVVEGIEYEDQVDFLKTVDIYSVQGYFFARPMSSKDFENLLDKQK